MLPTTATNVIALIGAFPYFKNSQAEMRLEAASQAISLTKRFPTSTLSSKMKDIGEIEADTKASEAKIEDKFLTIEEKIKAIEVKIHETEANLAAAILDKNEKLIEFIPWSRRLEDRPNFGLLRKGRRWEMTWREDQERFVALGALFKLI